MSPVGQFKNVLTKDDIASFNFKKNLLAFSGSSISISESVVELEVRPSLWKGKCKKRNARTLRIVNWAFYVIFTKMI